MADPVASPDLLLRNVRPMAGPAVDVLAEGGVIRRIGAGLASSTGALVVDGRGGILLPAFVDAHMHLDKTFWGLPWRPHEAGPTTRERIDTERRLRRERPLPIDDPQVRQPDISHARATLRWEPKISLDDGLRRTIEYFRGVIARQGAETR